MPSFALPRIVVAGLAGNAGKTLVTAGLVRALRRRGLRVAPFKKGPDFIDPAWLGAAAGREAHNLDSFLMTDEAIISSLHSQSAADIAVVEGNHGLFDGLDSRGTHSTAELAKRIGAPVVLVVDVSRSGRTVAALVLGCLALDPALPLAGIVLNRVGTTRHERVIRDALALATRVPVLGALPRLQSDHLPSRHLGLVMPNERDDGEHSLDAIADIVDRCVDIEAIRRLAGDARPLWSSTAAPASLPCPAAPVTIGVLRDEAFSFYYPENLAALEAAGATLVPISPLHDVELPQIDALYAGGGYPEEHAAALAGNSRLRLAIASRTRQGMPVWAECGGLMYLASSLVHRGERHPMVGALPIVVEQTARPQAHGYVEACVDRENPYLRCGTHLRGHEFHYSRLIRPQDNQPVLDTALSLHSGVGVADGRDGIVVGRVFASYLHLFAPGVPEWAPAFVRVAREARAERAPAQPETEAKTPADTGDDCGIYYGTRLVDRSRRGRVHSGACQVE